MLNTDPDSIMLDGYFGTPDYFGIDDSLFRYFVIITLNREMCGLIKSYEKEFIRILLLKNKNVLREGLSRLDKIKLKKLVYNDPDIISYIKYIRYLKGSLSYCYLCDIKLFHSLDKILLYNYKLAPI